MLQTLRCEPFKVTLRGIAETPIVLRNGRRRGFCLEHRLLERYRRNHRRRGRLRRCRPSYLDRRRRWSRRRR